MPHSLRVRLSGLRYKKIISDKDYDRLCKALDNENVLENIKSEITDKAYRNFDEHINDYTEEVVDLDDVIYIINKYSI